MGSLVGMSPKVLLRNYPRHCIVRPCTPGYIYYLTRPGTRARWPEGEFLARMTFGIYHLGRQPFKVQISTFRLLHTEVPRRGVLGGCASTRNPSYSVC